MSSKDSYTIILRKLDRFTRKYYQNQIIKGGLYVATIAASFFLIIVLLEYFNRFGGLLRSILFFSYILLNVFVAGYFIAIPLLRYFKLGNIISQEEASKIVGRHFPEVQDKLLNTLQLKSIESQGIDRSLIEASIEQKIKELKPIPFQRAIDLSKNKKYIKYVTVPAVIILVLLLTAPNIIKDSTVRIVQYKKHFESPAPFHFVIKNTDLNVPQYEDLNLSVEVKGKELPKEAYIYVDGNKYKLQKKSKTKFEYTLKNIQKDAVFRLEANKVHSKEYKIKVIPRPVLQRFEVKLNYPEYTGKKPEQLNDVGDLIVPSGTQIRWLFLSKNTDSLQLKLGGQLFQAQPEGENAFSFSEKLYKDKPYTVYPSNQYLKKQDSIQYYISVIPDVHPSIQVNQFRDSLDQNNIFFTGEVSDDYGLKNLFFKYQVLGKNRPDTASPKHTKRIPINTGSTREQFFYTWNLKLDTINPGDRVKYFFEVWDNDAVYGSKSSRSQIMYLQKPTREEMEEMAEKSGSQMKEKLSEISKEAERIKQKTAELRERVLREKNLTWEHKKAIKELLKKQADLQKKVESLRDKQKQYHKQLSEFQKQDEEIKEKQEQMEKMFDEMIDEETKKKLKELQDILEKLDKQNALDQMEKMKESNEDLSKDLDRMLELFKQLQLEQKLKESVKKLDTLSKKQEQLSQKTTDKKESTEELSKKQQELNKYFEEIQKDMKELEELNNQLQYKHKLENTDQQQQQIEQEMQKSLQQLQQQQRKNARQHQQNASDQMQNMSQKMQGMMQAMQKKMIMLNLKTVRQILENLIKLSFDQEEIIDRTGQVSVNSPEYQNLMEDQHDIKADMELVKDSLYALSKRVFQIQSVVDKEVKKIDENLGKSIHALEERQLNRARSKQQYTMTSINNLAVLLSEMMKQMQKQLAMKSSGKQMCQKPGGGKPVPKLSKQQQQLNQQMKQAQDQMKKSGKSQKMSKSLARLAREQAKIRQKLQDMQREGEGGGGKLKNMDEIQQQMEETEEDLVNKRLSSELLERQKKILTRLLEAENAMRKRKVSKERKAERPGDQQAPEPPSVEKYKKMKAQQMELYKTVPPTLKPYYKQLVEQYFQSISY